MKIGFLNKIMTIEDDYNTRINDEIDSLMLYSKTHPDEIVESIYVQDNGVVRIETKDRN